MCYLFDRNISYVRMHSGLLHVQMGAHFVQIRDMSARESFELFTSECK